MPRQCRFIENQAAAQGVCDGLKRVVLVLGFGVQHGLRFFHVLIQDVERVGLQCFACGYAPLDVLEHYLEGLGLGHGLPSFGTA